MKKIFQTFLILFGIIFFVVVGVFLFDEPLPGPSDNYYIEECEYLFSQGRYSQFSEDERLDACLEDSWKAVAGAITFEYILIIVLSLFGLLCLYFGLKVFKGNGKKLS